MSFTAETTTISAIAMVSAASNNTITATESSTDSTDSNTWTKQDEEEEEGIKIMMRRARGHFDKACVIRYSSITFWSFYLEGLLSRKKVCEVCGFFLWPCSAHNLMLQVCVVDKMTFFLLWFFLDVFSCGHVAEERAEQYNLIDAVCQELPEECAFDTSTKGKNQLVSAVRKTKTKEQCNQVH
jgi:hypothetical protein